MSIFFCYNTTLSFWAIPIGRTALFSKHKTNRTPPLSYSSSFLNEHYLYSSTGLKIRRKKEHCIVRTCVADECYTRGQGLKSERGKNTFVKCPRVEDTMNMQTVWEVCGGGACREALNEVGSVYVYTAWSSSEQYMYGDELFVFLEVFQWGAL